MKKTRIAVIAHNCRTGGALIGTLNLLKALKNVAHAEQILLICSRGYGYEEIKLPSNSETYVYEGRHSALQRTLFEEVTLPKIIARYGPDVIFGAANIGLTNPCAPQAVFIQQAYLFYDKNYYPDIHLTLRLRIAALKLQVKNSLTATNLVFCQTPVVKRRFSERFCYPEDRINILRWPPPTEIRPTAESEVPSAFDKSSENFYILLLTRYMPHRNPSILISLCKRYCKNIRDKRIKFITTVTAQEGRRARRFLKEICKQNLEDIIINVGCIMRKDVSKYLSHSDMLWLPTTLETLCLPFLEAMRIGLPILAPDMDFARYVCGDAAVFYNPWDIESIYSKIMLMRENALLRQELIERGKKGLCDRTRFAENWNEVAANLINDLRTLVK